MSIRAVRESSRRLLHAHMGEPARYYPTPTSMLPTSLVITARAHSNVAKAGDLAGTNLSYAETQDRVETLVFMVDEVPDPARNGLVIFDSATGYFINNNLPPNGITITSEVIRAEQRDLIGFRTPEGVEIIS